MNSHLPFGGCAVAAMSWSVGDRRSRIEPVIDQVLGALFGLFIGKYDVITDFKPGTDVIDLSAIDANTRRDGDQAFHFEGHDRLSRSRGELVYRFGQDGDGDRATIITGDANADFRIVLKGYLALDASDFIL